MVPRLILVAVSTLCLTPALGGMPKMPKNLGVHPRMAQRGPPWRKAMEKVFDEACLINKGAPSVFCFPDRKALLDSLQVEQYGIDMTGENYLMDVYVVLEQLLTWPPAWGMVAEVFDTANPWTKPFCDKIIGGAPWWHAVPLVRKSFLSPRQTLAQLQKDTPHVAAAMDKWFDSLRRGGNEQTQKLLKSFQTSDKADAKNRTVHARPFMQLMMQVHARAVKHMFGTACKGSDEAMKKLMQSDINGLTVLHHVASVGDSAGAKAIVKALPKEKRVEFVTARDNYGYTAADWARLSSFGDVVEVLDTAAKPPKGKKGEEKEKEETISVAEAIEPLKLFPAATGEPEGSDTCRWDGSSNACADADFGGWRPPAKAGLPADWMPPSDNPCFADAIDVSQFDLDTFLKHYVLHPRPLLIRGAALSGERARNYTREGLLEVAGDRNINAFSFVTAKEYDASTPMTSTLKEYVEFLGGRSENQKDAAKKLNVVFEALTTDEWTLNFTNKLPDILVDKVEHTGTQVMLGGYLMGFSPQFHGPSVSSLMFGRKLWFLEPPGKEFVVHEPIYDYLVRTGGAPEARRCIQEAGDLLYVPRSWTHSAICFGDCVAVANDFSHSQYDLRD